MSNKLTKPDVTPPDVQLNLAIPADTQITKEDYIDLAANLMGLARDNMRNDLIRIAVEEFDYIIRRRREIAVATMANQGTLEFIKRKEAALIAGEYTIDTTSGKLHFFDPELQPWL